MRGTGHQSNWRDEDKGKGVILEAGRRILLRELASLFWDRWNTASVQKSGNQEEENGLV